MARLLSRLWRCRRGIAATELAMLAPILLFALLGLADFGLAVNERMRLAGAVRAGAQAAMSDPANTAHIRQAVELAASSLVPARLNVAVSTACSCPDGSATACGGTCASGRIHSYVTVRVSEAYPLMLHYPGLGATIPLSADATLRY